jgi:hypothetical protein
VYTCVFVVRREVDGDRVFDWVYTAFLGEGVENPENQGPYLFFIDKEWRTVAVEKLESVACGDIVRRSKEKALRKREFHVLFTEGHGQGWRRTALIYDR